MKHYFLGIVENLRDLQTKIFVSSHYNPQCHLKCNSGWHNGNETFEVYIFNLVVKTNMVEASRNDEHSDNHKRHTFLLLCLNQKINSPWKKGSLVFF